MKTIKELNELIRNTKARSAWSRAVKEYAFELLENVEQNEGEDFEMYGSPSDRKMLLNGADNWINYSYGGCSLIYNFDIAERVCTPSELKNTEEGELAPNARENWLEVQARCLHHAS
ncbi:MAG: hypothetical protein WCL51_18265, partial [Bacteroidota bacterium]